MFRAFHRVQEPGDFLRAWHNRKFLRLPAGWNIIFDNPRPFEGNAVDKPERGHGDRYFIERWPQAPTYRAGTSLDRGHRRCQRASVQLSEKARAQVLNGLPSRWVGNGRPFA
jgi:hypothetical protein